MRTASTRSSACRTGDYEVTEILPTGWDVSPGFDSRQTVTVFAGAESIAADFANFSILNGSIRGTVWNDLNRNGVRDTSLSGAFTDPGLAGWTVYLDLNRNRLADPSEPSTLTDARRWLLVRRVAGGGLRSPRNLAERLGSGTYLQRQRDGHRILRHRVDRPGFRQLQSRGGHPGLRQRYGLERSQWKRPARCGPGHRRVHRTGAGRLDRVRRSQFERSSRCG